MRAQSSMFGICATSHMPFHGFPRSYVVLSCRALKSIFSFGKRDQDEE